MVRNRPECLFRMSPETETMIEIPIPGHSTLRISQLVLDYNGTLACDGSVLPGVSDRITALAENLQVHVVTADTFGTAAAALEGMPCKLTVLLADAQDEAKRDYVRELGATTTAAIGNGRNDSLMLDEAALGITVVQTEGAAKEAVLAADIVCKNIGDALDLLVNPKRITADLRS